MSCSVNSTRNWLKTEKIISEGSKVIKPLQASISFLLARAKTRFNVELPEAIKHNDVLYKNKSGSIGFYKPFFEWVDGENIKRTARINEARLQGVEDAERVGDEYTDDYLFFQTKALHYTREENINDILVQGFDSSKPAEFPLISGGKFGPEGTLYFTLDKTKWAKSYDFVGENKGDEDYIKYDYDNQKWIEIPKGNKTVNLSTIEVSLNDDNFMIIDSMKKYKEIQSKYFDNFYPKDRLNETLKKLKEDGYSGVVLKYTKEGFSNVYHYEEAFGKSGKYDFFVFDPTMVDINTKNKKIFHQLLGVESTLADDAVLNQVKVAAKKMGIKFNTLTKYAKEHPEIDISGVNALADLLQGTVAVAQGKEDVALTEEVVHIATAIIEQTNPDIITSLISKIGKYQIYQDTLKQYRNNKHYQTSDGKPNIRKIKKEALDKLLSEVIVKSDQDLNKFPELAYNENMNWLRKVWENIKQAIRGLVNRSDVDLFKQVAATISLGEVGGIASDLISDEIFLQTIENKSVDDMYDKLIEVHKDLEEILEVKSNTGELIKKRHYLYKGVEVDQTVTEKLNKNKVFKFLEDQPWKMKWGTEGHAYLELYIKNNLIDAKGYKKVKTNTPISTSLNRDVRVIIQLFAEDLINGYRKGTRFLTEVQAINETVEGGLASKIDFIALVPFKDKNGKESVKIDILDWKFTGFDESEFEDLSHGKQKAWKLQMNEYVKMMTTPLYKQTKENIRKARMIPFISHYSYNVPHIPSSGLYLNRIEVGDINDPKGTKLHLLPVPVDQESTGNIKVDQLIRGLEIQHIKIFKKLRNPEEKFKKTAELTALTQAIKKLRLQLDFDPLYNVGVSTNLKINKVLNRYEKIDFAKIDLNKIDSILGELLEFQHSLDKFTTLREVYDSYLGRDSDNLTEEELLTKRKIERVSIDASSLNKKIAQLQREFTIEEAVRRKIVLEENKQDVLKAEVEVNLMSYSFLEGTRLSAKIIKLGSHLLLKSKKLVDFRVKKKIEIYLKLLADLEEVASSMGVKAFSLIGDVKENDLQLINKINKEYYKNRKKAIEKEDKQFFKDNMDVNTYKKMVSEILKERYEEIDNTVYITNILENERRKKIAKRSLRNKIDIFSKDFYGINEPYFLYIYNANFLEENHYSKEFQDLKKNEAAYKVWSFFMELNADARDLGYLNKETQAFFPLIVATSIQKLLQTKNFGVQSLDFFKDVFMSRINETMDYNTFDPETGEVKKSIPKYFTRTDKNVEQLSRDLSLVGSLWISSIERYKNSKNLENTLHTLHRVETAKGHIITEGGNIVYNTGEPLTKEGNEKNARIFETIMDDGLYNKREGSGGLGNKVIDISSSKLTKTDEGKEELGVNIRKSITSLNNLVRLLALGAKIPLGVANYFGTQMQTLIKAGEFYTFKEYELAHAKVMFSNLGTLTDKEKGMLDLFIPLNEDIALETRRKAAWKQGYLKYISTWSFTDTLMLTMQFPEKKLQFSNGLAFLDNTLVVDGELVNIRQYLQQQDRENREGTTTEERRELRRGLKPKFFELTGSRVKELQESDMALKNVIKITDQGSHIPGITDEQIADYRTKIIDYNRTLNGMMDENDKMGFRRDTIFSSFMMFKSWIPKLVYVRTAELAKNIQTGNWEYGRIRAFLKTVLYKEMEVMNIETEKTKAFYTRWNMSVFRATRNINNILKMNDEGMEFLNKMLYDKKMKHLRETGQHLEITEEEFQDIMRDAIVAEFKEIAVLFSVFGSYLGASLAEPPPEATALELNRYKWIYRQINKIGDEITFYYNPLSTEAMLQGTFIPAVSLVAKVIKFNQQLGLEVYGNLTGDIEMVEDSHPTKYLFNLFPVLSHGQNEFLPYINPELAKKMGIRVTKESRR